jgi:hypothetical protein
VIDAPRVYPQRSALQEGGGGDLRGADFRRRLGRQREAHALEQKLQFRLRLRVSSEQNLTCVGGRDTHIDHLHGGKFLERTARGEPGARALSCRPSVTYRQYERKATNTCASMFSIL